MIDWTLFADTPPPEGLPIMVAAQDTDASWLIALVQAEDVGTAIKQGATHWAVPSPPSDGSPFEDGIQRILRAVKNFALEQTQLAADNPADYVGCTADDYVQWFAESGMDEA